MFDSDAFSVDAFSEDAFDFGGAVAAVVATSSSTGGWLFLNEYQLEQQRRKKKERQRQELEAETEQIAEQVDRQIAQFLREQEAIDDRREELARLKALVQADRDLKAAEAYSERVAIAYQAALEKGSRAALLKLEKEIKLAMDEEEDFMLIALMTVVD